VSKTVTQIHETHWHDFLDDQLHAALYESWWHKDRINYWRHTRLLEPALEVLGAFRPKTWLTIGDGAGTDAWRLIDAGLGKVLATDLEDTVLKKTKEAGYISDYQVANAEKLPFPDNSFDFVLCKETLHHMERPYLGLYESLRVARYAVAIIEPQDPFVDAPVSLGSFQPSYERVGNFVYSFSAHELQKLAYGQNLLGIATKGLIDIYIGGCEFKSTAPNEPMWIQIQQLIKQEEDRLRTNETKPNYLLGILFKNSVTREVFDYLGKSNSAWDFHLTKTNPYI
jgi:ubiquinone/menaquinone biosynthesis C-methylase UbiE